MKSFLKMYKLLINKGSEAMKLELIEPKDQDNAVDLRGTEDATSDVLVEDYKDMEIELMDSSRAKTLWWMKDYD